MRTIVAAGVASLVVAVAGAGLAPAARDAPTSPRFSAHVDNPWFPLRPGVTYVSVGVKDGKPARDVVTVMHETRRINGARCAVVRDRLYLQGRLAERTTDWYTQDNNGNVWYYGEDTAELDRSGRVVSTEGTWEAGVDGAIPGIFMPAVPRVGASYRQEFYKGHAEDHFRIVGRFGAVGQQNALLTEEWTPLEPGVLDHKLYVRGIGTVLEQSVKGPQERLELVAMRTAS